MKIRILSILPPLLWALLLGGCAGTPPASFYTLTPLAAAASRQGPLPDDGIALGLGPVHFPEFLDRPQLVSRDGANRLAVDEFHRWGGSLQDDFLRVLGENLAHLLGTSWIQVYPAEVRFPLDFRLVADVLSFEGAPGGEAVLKVRWTLLDPAQERALVAREGAYRHQAAGADQAAMAAALSATLGAFSRDLADELRRLPKIKPPI